MKGIGDYAAVCDIGANRERARVERILKGFGFRVQKSVFECRLTRRGLEELVGKLEALGLETGFVKIYRLERLAGSRVVGRDPGALTDCSAAFVF